ncbi:hypothetical protein BMS3Abin17_01295 [archaeon BMS3Abin17]|nr:hypothetical protein BMS3Abin17_01295 [archaeon BMS3Abin17]
MTKIVRKQEILCFEGISISDLLDKNFLKKLSEKDLKIDPISLVFMVKEMNEKKEIYPIILGHESNEELSKKIMHVNAPSNESSKKFIKLLEEIDDAR